MQWKWLQKSSTRICSSTHKGIGHLRNSQDIIIDETGFLSEESSMEKIKVVFDQESNTLHVWFDDPSKEYVCEETGDEVILIKDINGKVIGFEKLNYRSKNVFDQPEVEMEIV